MAGRTKILLVEDNEKIVKANKEALEMEGYEVLTALSLAQARILFDEVKPDVILLDIMLPDGSGIDFCRAIRAHTEAPILFLTALGEKHQVIEGLRIGGDDYITKPYDLDELVARIEAFLRRRTQARQPWREITCGDLLLDILASQAFLGGEDMLLTPKEFALLLVLVQNESKALSPKFLYEEVWHRPAWEETRAVTTNISRLRKKFGERGEEYQILSERGKGYMFICNKK
jgi:DNA-binding response OmpR family regulator